eukprot:CAMPEP_0172019104 /NCGR_PEP_ID=MMETSP1041-20130122/12460_1 /TAXON_ID=464988 /ORGANISM="Hemiselmis andersenii, Strain CCMP439" /LENGTH=251 /DNA_ID=CAMNT_0012674259 /DNA_START=311 /DNA_END=1063 /DNA_ORIENTATION=+
MEGRTRAPYPAGGGDPFLQGVNGVGLNGGPTDDKPIGGRAALLDGESSGSSRLDGLEAVREFVINSNGLPTDDRLKQRLFAIACKCASDQNSRIAHKWLQFIHELASQYGEDVVSSLQELLPVCIKSLGSTSSSVRKASVQVLCACAKVRDHNPEVILRGISHGLESADERVRSEACAALVTVYSSARYKNAVAEAVVLQELVVPIIVDRLTDPSKLVVGTAAQALGAVRQRAPDAFQVILMQLPPDTQRL